MGKRLMILAMVSLVLSMCITPGINTSGKAGRDDSNLTSTGKAWTNPDKADEDAASGSAVRFEFDEKTGTLTFTGEGEIHDNYAIYEEGKEPDWFKHIKKTKKLVIGEGIQRIGAAAFYEFPYLESVTLPDTLTEIDSWAFRYCFALDKIEFPKNLIKLGHEAFGGCVFMKQITIPNGLKQMCSLSGCMSLEEVIFPDSITDLEDELLSSCISVERVRLPVHMKRIKKYDFADCVYLHELKIPKTVTSVCMSAFASCGLKVIDLPKNVTKILNGDAGRKVFVKKKFSYGNRKLKTIILRSKKIRTIQKNSFSGLKKRVVIRVPKERLEKYREMLYKSGMSRKNKVKAI